VFPFGCIVLARFPFTDLSGDKRRPALVVSRDNDRRSDLVVCFITSVQRSGPDMAAIPMTGGTGLKVPSLVRFDKVATLDRSVIAGKSARRRPIGCTRTGLFSSACSVSASPRLCRSPPGPCPSRPYRPATESQIARSPSAPYVSGQRQQ
jgi:mRNA interferase MazF